MSVWSARFGRKNACLAGCGEEPLLGREGETPFRKGGGVWFVTEWCEGKCFKKCGERVQGKMDTS